MLDLDAAVAAERAHTCGVAGGINSAGRPCAWNTPLGQRCRRHPMPEDGATEMEIAATRAELARWIAAEGQVAMRRIKLAQPGLYVVLSSFRSIARTRQQVVVAVARQELTVERGAAILKACRDEERKLENRLDEREQAVLEAERALARERARR